VKVLSAATGGAASAVVCGAAGAVAYLMGGPLGRAMRARAERARTLASAVVTEVRAENVTFMAGSIAYHAFVSLLPLLLLLLAVATLVGDQSVERAIFAVAEAMLSRGAGEALVGELRSSTESTGLSLLGVVVLLWGTLRIFRGLDTAFSDIYETEATNTFLDQVSDGLVVLVAVGLAIVVVGSVGDLARTGVPALDRVLGGVLAVGGLSLAFLPMYYVFPDAEVTVAEVVPGTVFAAVGLATFETLFGLYLQLPSRTPDGDVVAGVVVLLTWLYFSGLVILLGAVLNAVLANRSRDVDVAPVFGGEPVAGRSGGAPASREELVDAVDRLEGLLAEDPEVRIAAGDSELTVPAPTHVVADTDAPMLLARGRPVRLELQWTPARASTAPEGSTGQENRTD